MEVGGDEETLSSFPLLVFMAVDANTLVFLTYMLFLQSVLSRESFKSISLTHDERISDEKNNLPNRTA